MRAILNNYRQSSRKMRLVADAVKGKSVRDARAVLSLLPKTAAKPLLKLLESAAANAKENAHVENTDTLIISDLRVNAGPTLKRSMPRARGSAYQILKRTSKVTLILAEGEKAQTTNSTVRTNPDNQKAK